MSTVPDSGPTDAAAPIPASPARSFVWAAAWVVVAALGGVVLVLDWQGVLNSDLSGQRTEGIVLFTPVAAAVIAILLVVRGARSLGAMRGYRARYSAAERARRQRERFAGQPSTPFIVFAAGLGVLWLAGTVATLIFLPNLLQRPSGLSLALMLLALLAMACISVLQAGLRRRAAELPPVGA